MDLIRLRYFQTVAKTLHFRRAAALLNVSQPPLSKSIKTLEDQLGTPLFVRSRRHVELTPAGQVLLERCETIFQELEDAKTEVKRYSPGEKGTIRIGCEDGTPLVPCHRFSRRSLNYVSSHFLLCCHSTCRPANLRATLR